MNRTRLKVMKIFDDAKLPQYATEKSAGADLFAYIDNEYGEDYVIIYPGKTIVIGTGLKIQPEDGFACYISARSGLATKRGLRPANCRGICDEDYRGEYKVALHNDSDQPQLVVHGDKIAQLEVCPYWQADFEEVTSLDDTERGTGGFGSTGV